MANDDFDALKDLLDGLDNEIAAISLNQAVPKPAKAVGNSADKKKENQSSQYPYASSEYAISHSFFNTPSLPFRVQAIRDYMDDIDGNLCFMESEMIDVVAVDDSAGLFLGEMPGGRRGWFPRTHVEIIGAEKANLEIPTVAGFGDFGELSFDPATIDLGPPPDEDFSTLNFDDPPALNPNDMNDFGGVTFADLGTTGGLDDLGPPPQFDDLGPPPKFDDLGPPPTFDELGPLPKFDDLGPPPQFDALDGLGPPPKFDDLGPPPNFDDLGPPPQFGLVMPQFDDLGGAPHHFNDFAPPPTLTNLGPPPSFDELGPPPQFDNLGSASHFDNLGPPPQFDDLGPPPQFDSLGPPPQFDSLGPPPQFDDFAHNSHYGSHYDGMGMPPAHMSSYHSQYPVNEFGVQNLKDFVVNDFAPPPTMDFSAGYNDFAIDPHFAKTIVVNDLGPPPNLDQLGPPPDMDSPEVPDMDALGPPPDIDALGPPPSIDDLGLPPDMDKKDEKYPWEQHEYVHGKTIELDEKYPWEQDDEKDKDKEKELVKGRGGSVPPPKAESSGNRSVYEEPTRLSTEPEIEDLPTTVEFTPIAQAFNAQNPTQQKEQDKLRKTHLKELTTREAAAQLVRTKRASGHKGTLTALEKQHDKDVAAQKKDESDRPTKLNTQHIAEQKQFQKEMEVENKNRVAGHKKAMKTWLGDQQVELKNKISTLKVQYKKDKNTLKQKKAQMEGEAKIRQQQYQDRDLLEVEHQFQNDRGGKEREMGSNQLKATHDLELELQQSRHRLERRHLQELQREQQKQLQEVHEDETEALALRLPIEEKHLQEQIELDQEQLAKQQAHELEELSQQILNQQKNDRREFAKKKKLDEKDHLNNLKQIKKSKDKNAVAAEKQKFEKDQEKAERDFEQNIKDEATRKENDLKACHEQQKKEMRSVHKATEEKLRQQHDTLRKQLEKKQSSEKQGLTEKQRQEFTDLLERQHREATGLQKRHHEQTRTLVREQNENRSALFEKQYTEKKELFASHALQLQQSPHCTLTDQEKQEQQQFEQQIMRDRTALKTEFENIMVQLEEKLAASASELKSEQERDRREVF